MKKNIFFVLVVCFFALGKMPLEAAYIIKNGSMINVKDEATLSLEEHYNKGVEALKKKEWPEAVQQFRIVTINFADCELVQDAYYFLGVSYYNADDVDLANKSLNIYLQKQKNAKHFEATFRYKLAIGEAFKAGAKKHLFNQEKLPQLFSAKEEAITVFDEIVNALPNHELAAKALFSKADLHRQEGDYKQSIETYQQLIKKFPKSDMACQAYVKVAEVALEECKVEFQNPDLLALAQINLKKLNADFPRAVEQIQLAKTHFAEMQEVYAKGLFETGMLYERKKLPKASVLYYNQAITDFPETKVARDCKTRLNALDVYAKELATP